MHIISGQRLADEADSDAISDAAGGEGGHGTATANSTFLAISDVMHSKQKFVRRRPVLQRPFDSPHHIYNQQGVA
jgi:hypothetical protein